MDSPSKDNRISLKKKVKTPNSSKNQDFSGSLKQDSQKSGKDSSSLKNSFNTQESLKVKETSVTAKAQSHSKMASFLKKKSSLKDQESLKEDFIQKFKEKEELLLNRVKKAETEFLYLRAEFENYKKRTLEEKYRLLRYSGENFIKELATEVLDDLDRALLVAQDHKSIEDVQKGLQMIDKKLKKLYQKFGIEVLDPKGKAFDPSYQEALSYVENSNLPEDQVVETYKKAYKLYDKVIRPAQVLVSKKASKDSV